MAGLEFDRLCEADVVRHIIAASQNGSGGWIATPNVDICRQARRDPAAAALIREAALIVPDGMPLIWAARLRGDPLCERVTGSSLIYSLTSAAADSGRSVYFLGGEHGVPDLAGTRLASLYPGLKVAGASAPPVGFDQTPDGVTAVRESLALAAPDIVYVGLGFPKQERLISQLAPGLPGMWFVACGAAIPFAAGAVPRAPRWMQRAGLEWMFRLLREPRRLFRRYLVDDLPYAAGLLLVSLARGLRVLGPDGDDRLRDAQDPLPADASIGEVGPHLRGADQLGGHDLVQSGSRFPAAGMAERPGRSQAPPERQREKLHAGKDPVGLNREIAVRRLHEVPRGEGPHRTGQGAPRIMPSDMLNQAVGEHQVK